MALQVSQVAYEHREILLRDKPEHMLALSPKGTVPVLWLADAPGHKVLDESLDIMLWALDQHDPLRWLPASPEDRAAALARIALNDELSTGIQDRDLGAVFLWQINADLQKNAFLNGQHWGLTDAALAPFVRQFAHVDADWFAAQGWSALHVWLENFENSPGFLKAMQKVALWQADQVHEKTPQSADTPT
eukprot:gene23040-29232_t